MTLNTWQLRTISTAKSLRAGARACMLPACLALVGCTVQTGLPAPNVMINTPGAGTVPLSAPEPVMPGGSPPPPPGLGSTLPAPTQPASRDGTYTGSMEPLSSAGGLCTSVIKVTGFRVRGNSVRFGDYRGTIAADGGLQMVYRNVWIIGQFEGATFHGEVDGSGTFPNPTCSFIMTLERTGP